MSQRRFSATGIAFLFVGLGLILLALWQGPVPTPIASHVAVGAMGGFFAGVGTVILIDDWLEREP